MPLQHCPCLLYAEYVRIQSSRRYLVRPDPVMIFLCTVILHVFVGHLISYISWVVQSDNLRYQQFFKRKRFAS